MNCGETMDETYVMLLPDSPEEFPAGLALRREEAMRQWIHVRAETDFVEAMQCVRADDPAWRAFANAHRDTLARHVRVAEDEMLGELPLAFTFDRRTLPPTGDALIDALAVVDEEMFLRAVEHSDPLAWQCTHRGAQHEWFYWNAVPSLAPEAVPGTGTPRPRTPTGPPSRPQLPADHAPVHRKLTVVVDTLAWPPIRRVTAPTPVLTGTPRPIIADTPTARGGRRGRGHGRRPRSRSPRRPSSRSDKRRRVDPETSAAAAPK